MLVSKINLMATPRIQNSISKSFLPSFGVKKDEFVKSESTEKHQKEKPENLSYNEFKKWAKKNDFLNRTDLTNNQIDETDDSKIYAITGTDKWVLQKYNRAEIIPGSHSKPVMSKVKDIMPEVNIGQTVARIEIPINKAYSSLYFVNKRQNGHTVAIPEDRASKYLKEDEKQFKKNIQEVTRAPQEAFDKLVKDTLTLLSNGYDFDASKSSNLIYDEKSQEFHIKNVKRLDGLNGVSEHKPAQARQSTHYSEIFTTLLGGKYGVKYYQDTHNKDNHNVPNDSELRDNLFKLTLKYTAAMRNNSTDYRETDTLNKILHSGVLDRVILPNTTYTRFSELRHMAVK